MEIKDSIFVRIKDVRVALEDIKAYFPSEIEYEWSGISIYCIDLETNTGNYKIKFSTKKERDSTLKNLDTLFSVHKT